MLPDTASLPEVIWKVYGSLLLSTTVSLKERTTFSGAVHGQSPQLLGLVNGVSVAQFGFGSSIHAIVVDSTFVKVALVNFYIGI